jgi:hypothetical protein
MVVSEDDAELAATATVATKREANRVSPRPPGRGAQHRARRSAVAARPASCCRNVRTGAAATYDPFVSYADTRESFFKHGRFDHHRQHRDG